MYYHRISPGEKYSQRLEVSYNMPPARYLVKSLLPFQKDPPCTLSLTVGNPIAADEIPAASPPSVANARVFLDADHKCSVVIEDRSSDLDQPCIVGRITNDYAGNITLCYDSFVPLGHDLRREFSWTNEVTGEVLPSPAAPPITPAFPSYAFPRCLVSAPRLISRLVTAAPFSTKSNPRQRI